MIGRWIWWWGGLVCLAVLLVSCRQAETLPEMAAEEVVARAAERMATLEGFHFNVVRRGAPAYIDPVQKTLSFSRAEGVYVAPDRAQAVVRVIAPGFITEVGVVSVGEVQWETNVVTGEWQELPPNWGFNPTVLFDDEIGLQAILAQDTAELTLLEGATLADDDTLLYVVEGKMGGGRAYEMSAGLLGPEEMPFTLWVDPETFDVRRVVVVEWPGDEEQESEWELTFEKFGQVMEILPPEGFLE
ncbi:MAG TPA: LppX_LprAFG lipoprotein [Anaerolineae bacterium]|nr:LppX_LprAFG lipoprotein [Anaerolineae bacterium]